MLRGPGGTGRWYICRKEKPSCGTSYPSIHFRNIPKTCDSQIPLFCVLKPTIAFLEAKVYHGIPLTIKMQPQCSHGAVMRSKWHLRISQEGLFST